ncbi:MAG: glutamyl-tRNA reductase, partial [Verrucomicrobia bacterium]|nr:glutamyl-tRNA reductase [Verrucomicrobiota bacterium]
MLLCLGVNHRTTPIELRERVAFAESKIPDAARAIKSLPGFGESVVLSTCNRVEIYTARDTADHAAGFSSLSGYLAEHFALTPEQSSALTSYHLSETDAARHLFRVVSGIDSMVLGETEIFGQVKAAYDAALKAGATGRDLNKLFQRAFSVGILVRNETT